MFFHWCKCSGKYERWAVISDGDAGDKLSTTHSVVVTTLTVFLQAQNHLLSNKTVNINAHTNNIHKVKNMLEED